MTVLVTGGSGYIGSHTVLVLIEKGFDVVVLDNLSNSSYTALTRVENIVGKKIRFYQGDIRDHVVLTNLFDKENINSVIHFAGLKSVGESVASPLMYYDNNVVGTLSLLKEMKRNNVKKFIFSSSATVYGDPTAIPLTEFSDVGQTTNPYGTTKYHIERIINDLCRADSAFNATVLRYFNPAGAHASGTIGESPRGIPNNILPYITQVAVGKLPHLNIFGGDYLTKDGTGVRDYIHVMDLAEGHIVALNKIDDGDNLKVYNLGTGIGYSVLDIINTFEKVANTKLAYKITERRAGDIAECWSDSSLALKELNWKAERNLEDMLRDSWRWQVNNPFGYND